MNEVIVFFYLGSVAEGLNDLTSFMSFFTGLLTVCWAAVGIITGAVDESWGAWETFKQYGKFVFAIFFLSALVSVIVPGEKFFYTIAGLKAGEVVFESEIGQLAYDRLVEELRGEE